MLWRSLPDSDHAPRFDLTLLHGLWHFAAGVSATSIVSFFISQADRVVLSKILPLEFFGYYTLAATLKSGLVMITSQVSRALFPRFTVLIASNNEAELKNLYHKGGQSISVLAFSLAAVFALFSKDLLQMWTQDHLVAERTAPIVALLVIGSAINAAISLLYSLAVAHGWSSLGFYINSIAIFFFLPAMIGFSLLWGGSGAALALLALNVGYLIFTPFIIHKKILQGELRRWYLKDVALPAVTVALAVFASRAFLSSVFPSLPAFIVIFLCGLFTILAAAFSAAETRSWMLLVLRNFLRGGQSALS